MLSEELSIGEMIKLREELGTRNTLDIIHLINNYDLTVLFLDRERNKFEVCISQSF